MRRSMLYFNLLDRNKACKAAEFAKTTFSQTVLSNTKKNAEWVKNNNSDLHSFFQKKEHEQNTKNEMKANDEPKKAYDDDNIACSQ